MPTHIHTDIRICIHIHARTGDNGPEGPQGKEGAAGKDGAAGAPGAAGAAGAPGAAGECSNHKPALHMPNAFFFFRSEKNGYCVSLLSVLVIM